MARKDFHAASSAAAVRFSSFQLMTGIVALGALVLLLEWTLIADRDVTPVTLYLKQEAAEGADLYPDAIVASPLARDVGESDLVHLSLLHEACLKHKDAVIPWTYGLGGKVASPDSGLIERDDPDLIDKIRDCPDVDLFLPLGIRGHGYCEDSIAYTKCAYSCEIDVWV